MAHSVDRPNFGPIPSELLDTPHPPTDKDLAEEKRAIYDDLRFLAHTTFNSYVPYGWGYTIYRAVFGSDSDVRFTEGILRLERWIQWYIRSSRYTENDAEIWRVFPNCAPAPGDHDPTDEIAERMWNEIIEDYPDADQVIADPEGKEDFSPVGRAFTSWATSLGVDLSGLNARYDNCLIVDEAALKTLETLPTDLPPITLFREEGLENAFSAEESPENAAVTKLLRDTWVWILDRDTMESYEDGEQAEFPPWIRIRLHSLPYLWFMRPQGLVTSYWQGLVEEDGEKWQDVRWWTPYACSINEVRRAAREREENNSPIYNTNLDI